MGPRVGLDGCGKSRHPPGFDPRTVQPVASRYTDWAIAAHTIRLIKYINWLLFPVKEKETRKIVVKSLNEDPKVLESLRTERALVTCCQLQWL
jgi:hypothetical protein